MSNPIISTIIPLYNAEKYIARCLDSILAQDMDAGKLEIIVVDDGSTDGGAAIVDRYATKHSDIRLIKQANGGVSSARNRGLKEASGDYVHFVDADDALIVGGV